MVYVSSYNIISSLGFTINDNLDRINRNVSGIKKTDDISLSPEPVYVSLIDRNDLEIKFKEIESDSGYTSFEKIMIYSISDAIKSNQSIIFNPDTLLVITTTKGNIDLLKPDNRNKFEADRVQLWKSSEIIKTRFGHPNDSITVSNACISGTLAIIIAKRLLDSGKYKHAIVSGADILPEFTLSGFQVFKAVGKGACKPFDKDRNGMTPGEGAGTVVLTTDPGLAMKPFVYITGGSSGNDANHISGPSKSGEEPAATIQRTLVESGLNSKDIDYISAHGTATIYNDESEAKAFYLSGLNNVHLNSFKGYLGHTFGAAGIIETILSIESLKNNKLYKSLGFEEQPTENPLNVITQNKSSEIGHVLKTASGFGGSNASLIFGKKNKSLNHRSSFGFNIINKVILSNDRLFFDNSEQPLDFVSPGHQSSIDFIKHLYKYSKIQYPKFFKMDILCKTAIMACEFLLRENETFKKYASEEIAVILSNGSSSLNTDAEYQKSINDRTEYFPSPTVFVYTLPNIMVGEICIRHKIKGENSVFISKDFNKEFIFNYVKILFETEKAKACIAGRIDHHYPEGNIFAELYLIESNK